jgi:hypothetical protein
MMNWSDFIQGETEVGCEFARGFERRHTEMFAQDPSVLSFLKAFQLINIKKLTSEEILVVLPRGIEGNHDGEWTMLEISNLPVIDVWRMDLRSTNVVKFEWVGPIGRERDLAEIVKPPLNITINPRRLMTECWMAREACAQGMLTKARTNARAFGIGVSTEQERVIDEAPARGAGGGGGGGGLAMPAALREHMGTDQGKWMSWYNDIMQVELAKIVTHQTGERPPRGEVSGVDRKVEEVTQEFRIKTLDGTMVILNTKNDSQKRRGFARIH